MAFSINDLQDLIALLAEKPEWRAQLRPLILGDEFDRLPQTMQELAEAQRRTEARIEELAEAQRRTEARIEELAEAQRRTETRVGELAGRLEELTGTVQELGRKVDRLADSVDSLVVWARWTDIRLDAWDGFWSRNLFEKYARDYFGDLVRRARVISVEEAGADDAFDAGKITAAELRQLDNLDIVVRGKSQSEPGAEITLAIEISKTIDYSDVERAAERAAIFRKAGIPAKAAVGGARIDERVAKFASERDVFVKLVAAAEMPK